MFHLIVVGSHLGRLHLAASQRRRHRYRPGTRRNWRSSQTVYLQFCLFYGLNWKNVSLDDLGAFFELLVQAGRSLGTIKNYISAVKALYYERNVVRVIDLFQWDGWTAMVRGLQNTVRPTGDMRTAVTMEQLQVMVQYCDTDKALLPLKLGLIFGFFGYLRLSNLVPQTVSDFDSSNME